MKLRALIATLVLGVAATITAPVAHAQNSCYSYMCMAGLAGFGASGGPGCAGGVASFFAIVIFDPYFDPVATSNARRVYLMTCPGANVAENAGILAAIIAEYGAVP